ncbi:sigma 54-interacting transcriptional regulator [Vallitalea guaymasensis]|uniref:Sigma 54-interacting transcriptional regulator n=1 Tax=Vallitalea guaymasensis TaxID=1185412 RepID=A0A8J8MA23_9FIRM|nr:sigma 54-interacting transcriptional regulator [Vallitalea guaymasensis]QUH28890.1 sigma 54-interacting transcriptional regulator [Vallitalea guaymasensis]
MYLVELKEIASKFAETISKILNIDVIIIDDKYNMIGNTFYYTDEPTPISRYSMLGEVMHTGKVVAVSDKSTYKHCKNCPDLKKCAISGLVSVPIFFENKVVGAIALLVPVNKTSPVFENLQNSIEFLERMSDLLSSKLYSTDNYNKLNVIKKEREIIINMIEDALVLINNKKEVVHYNQQFEKYFKIEKDITGDNIEQIIDHQLIHEMMMFREDFSYKVFSYDKGNNSFYGFISSRNIIINGIDHGMLLTFKSIGKVYNALNEIMDNKVNISFDTLLGNDPVFVDQINKAKQLSVTSENILICGKPGLGKSVLSRAIHNFSDRSNQYFLYVDCENIPYELLEHEIFGSENETTVLNPSIGKLRMAHKGTIFFKNISEMPLYLQKRLVEVIKTKQIKLGTYKGFNLDIRMIFDTSHDLDSLVKQGSFDEELYYRISKNTITIPSLEERKGDIKIIVDNTLHKLKNKYMKTNLLIQEEVLDMMYNYSWPNNVREIEKVMERIICNSDSDVITPEDVKHLNFASGSNKEIMNVEDMEKELIIKMMKKYKSKNQVAEAMGIGRATLYRKLKKYELN